MPSNLREQFNHVRNLQAKACNTAISAGCCGSVVLFGNALSIVFNNSAAPLNVVGAVAGLAIIGLGFALGRKYKKQADAAVDAAVQSAEDERKKLPPDQYRLPQGHEIWTPDEPK